MYRTRQPVRECVENDLLRRMRGAGRSFDGSFAVDCGRGMAKFHKVKPLSQMPLLRRRSSRIHTCRPAETRRTDKASDTSAECVFSNDLWMMSNLDALTLTSRNVSLV